MALNPGYAKQVVDSDGSTTWTVEDAALTDSNALYESMALLMEDQFKLLVERIKGEPMDEDHVEGIRLLFISIARGVLGYLKDRPDEINVGDNTDPSITLHDHPVALEITWPEATK